MLIRCVDVDAGAMGEYVAEMTEILGKYGKLIFIEDVALENPMKPPVNAD